MQNLIPFCVLIISYIALGETLHRLEIVNMSVSFGGVLLIIIMSASSKQSLSIGDVGDKGNSQFILGVLANATCALCFSIINVVVRSLKDVHHSIVACFQSTANFLLSLVGLVIYRVFFNPNNFEYDFTSLEIGLLMFTGVVRSLGMIFFVLAFQLDKAGRSASLNFLQVIFGYMFDMMFFGYVMEGYEVLGTSIIGVCSVMVFLIKIYKVRET